MTTLLAAAASAPKLVWAAGLRDGPKHEQLARLHDRYMTLRERAATARLSPDLRDDVLALRDVLATLGLDRELLGQVEEVAINIGDSEPSSVDVRATRLAKVLEGDGELFRAGLMRLIPINLARHATEEWFTERLQEFDDFFERYGPHRRQDHRAYLLHQRQRLGVLAPRPRQAGVS